MTSIVKFQALSGALDESPYCYLLQVDDFTFLLDCGWDEKFDDVYIAEVIKHVPQIDAVLLSFPDPLHIGALPYLVGKCGLTCPVYATVPVYKMGQMFMYDIYQSRQNGEDFSLFTLDDVDAAFDKIIQLKYNQSCGLKGKGYGLTITPLPAGHMLGGTAWKIVKDGEEDIVYAVDYNHKKERHLNSCELEKIQRPSLLITDGYNATYQQPRRRARDEKLMTNILQTLRNNGNVLVAVDTAGRVLELSHMLDQLWRNKESGLMAYSLAMLNNVSYNVVEFAKSQIEWMSDKLMRSFEGARNNPFQFKHLQLCHSMAELNRVPSPKVVLASTPDMECGFSRELFAQWCENPRNSIVITSRSSPGTLSRKLIDNRNLKKVTLEIHKRVKLEGSELEEYMRKEKEKVVENNLKIEPMLEDESSDSEDEMSTAIKGKHDIILKSEDKINVTGFFKSSRKQFPMYPYHEEKVRSDEYGEIIRPEDFTVVDGIEEIEIDKPEKKRKFGKKDEEAPDAPEVPTKCVTETVTLAIMASVTYIDFEGRSDGESIQKIVQQMRPRRTVLVRGTAEACDVLASLLLTNPAAGVPGPTGECKVFIPKIGDIVDATMESHIFQVRLKDSLLSSLNFSRIKEGEVAWLDGKIAFHWEDMQDITLDEDPSKEGIAITKKGLAPVLEPLSADEVAGHSATFINELKLSDFKQVLVKYGISSEFVGGVLWCCNATVGLRKNEAGQMILEGCLSEDYFKVRDILYEQYAIV